VPDVTLPAKTATLLKADGSDWAGGPCAIRRLNVAYNRNYPELITFANNTRGFSEIGDGQDYIDSMTLEAYDDGTVAAIKNAVARESTQGIFTLRVPHLNEAAVTVYLIRFFECDFQPQTDRRPGWPRVFTAEITDIEVLDQETS
jgi:hypothetical protein